MREQGGAGEYRDAVSLLTVGSDNLVSKTQSDALPAHPLPIQTTLEARQPHTA